MILLGLAANGCASSSPARKTTSTGTRATAVASTNGTAKGHWVEEPYAQTGSHLRRRFWVPDGTSDQDAAAGAAGTFAPIEANKPGMRESVKTMGNGLRQG